MYTSSKTGNQLYKCVPFCFDQHNNCGRQAPEQQPSLAFKRKAGLSTEAKVNSFPLKRAGHSSHWQIAEQFISCLVLQAAFWACGSSPALILSKDL